MKQNAQLVYGWLMNHVKKGVDLIKDLQSQANKNTRAWLGGVAPVVLETFDKLPESTRKIAPFLPWIFLLLFTLNLFGYFDKAPAQVRAQNPNIVYVNEDVEKMITEGKAIVGPFV